MDIKSKNFHKLAVIIICLVILLPSSAMMVVRPHYIKEKTGKDEFPFAYSSIMEQLVTSSYVLYAEETLNKDTDLTPYEIFCGSSSPASGSGEKASPEMDSSEEYSDGSDADSQEEWVMDEVQDDYDNWSGEFAQMRPYLEYEVLNKETGKVLDTNYSGAGNNVSLYQSLNDIHTGSVLEDASDYAFAAAIEYGENGNIESTPFYSHEKSTASQALNERAKSNPFSYLNENWELNLSFQKPENRIYCFAITDTSLEALMEDYPGMIYTYNSSDASTEDLMVFFLTLSGMVAAAALLLPLIKPLHTGQEKIFQIPFELVMIISISVLSISLAVSANPYTMNQQSIYSVLTGIGWKEGSANAMQYFWGLLGWVMIFAVFYWTAGCIRMIFVLGPRQYIRERVFCYRIFPWLKNLWSRIYNGLLHINLKEDTNRFLIKIVLINFIILGFISLMWVWGIVALLVYSVVLFFLLRKYFRKIQDQYHLLLEATNELAKGNLNGTIPEDLGVFEPFREEIDKIQTGFKKAVDEEVKSTKMKTDLITNVSHDLKTPLTAIITYVDLLKQPGLPEEEKKKYIDILDQKANRLKYLIEDLFEISKATSKTVTLNIDDIDIVSLLLQVKLELQDKIEAAGLNFRMNLPEEKIILPLDGQRTYRIFENLIVNITKYALPGTRVYIHAENTENHVKISMKNISASELDFSPAEITERFVRGDASRNTEGSGLGLAIAKSFTELQGGRLEVMTDADLFTVEITFLK